MPKYGFQITPSYIPEDSSGVPTSSTTPLRFPGIVQEGKTTSKWNIKEFRGFKPSGATDQRFVDLIVPTKNEYEYTMMYVPIKRVSAPKYDFRHFVGYVLNNSSSTAAGGAWTYGTSVTSSLNTFTLYKQTSNLTQQMNGCLAYKLMGKASVDNAFEITVDGMGTMSTYASLNRTAASSLSNGTPFMWSDITTYINGSLATNVTAMDFTIDNKATLEWTLGNRDPRVNYPKGREITVKLTRFFNDVLDYSNFKAGTLTSITFVLSDPAGNPQFNFRNCVPEEFPNPSDIEKLLTADITYKCGSMGIV